MICYSGLCQWEDHMGECNKLLFSLKNINCPSEFEINKSKNGKWTVMEYGVVGGPIMEEPLIFDTIEQAKDWVSAQEFAYDLLVKIELESK